MPKRILDKESLEKLYITENLNLEQVAECLHSSVRTVCRNLDEHGLHRRSNGEVHIHHGMSSTRPYHIWQGLKTRCTNESQPNFQKYGANGISYPPEWETFNGFWHDMAEDYADNKTIDRKDNSKPYSKTNCHWTSCQEQSRNKSDNVLLTFHGKTQCVTTWAEELHLPRRLLYNRKQSGWSDERILTTPTQTEYIRG